VAKVGKFTSPVNVKGLKRTPGRYDGEHYVIEFLLLMKKMDRVPEIGGQQRGYMTSRVKRNGGEGGPGRVTMRRDVIDLLRSNCFSPGVSSVYFLFVLSFLACSYELIHSSLSLHVPLGAECYAVWPSQRLHNWPESAILSAKETSTLKLIIIMLDES
jgi:hypothetical protein